MKSKINISYCPGCKWLARSAWMAQELLTTFSDELEEISLSPSEVGGFFEIKVNGKVLWNRKERGGFPDIKTLKNLVRNEVSPEKDLGHTELE